jgi:RNA polymerase sigma factor (sigma-70 family)
MTPMLPIADRGDDVARLALAHRDALIERLMPMARRVASQYRGPRVDSDELEAIAYSALVIAADRYDPTSFPQDSFARYAERVIRSHIRDALATAPIVRQGRDQERAALRRGDAASGWAPLGLAVEDLGLATSDPTGPMADIDEALAACDELERSLIELVYVDGLSPAQAGRRLGIPVAAARKGYNAAMVRLAAEFRAMGYDPRTAPDLAAVN